ncbi:uncharacterized protein LOC125859066 [Solanum stenotomum]|uniref:uncharacterized protein LOC125859066 n=1 Tax=Solanum stenotomum TaxID=172797 RepID=UPI0020D00D08|nr:uncharacterized protein LOC125859066 [Solanum stenotomum]
MTDNDEFNVAANIMIPIENPEGSRNMTDIQNEEKMAHMQQELEILREELCQVRDLTKLSATTFPTFKMPIYFPKDDLPADLPNQPEQTQHALAHGRVPPASLTPVRTIPDLPNCDPTIPTMQKLLGAQVAAPYEPHVPPVYATGAPTFQRHLPLISHMRSINMQKWRKMLDINVSLGYKSPKFDMYDGKGDPHAYLRVYCDKLVGVGRNKKQRMMLFIRSLFGEALTWYTRQDPRKWRDWQEMDDDFMNHFRFNTEITAERFLLNNIQKKPFENFQEYA